MDPTSASWSWRHRFYAFLLRRAMGPFLTPQSAADLHRSIRAIDWSTGKFALIDVELDPAYLTAAVRGKKNDDSSGRNSGPPGKCRRDASSNAFDNIAVRQARIRRFTIQLSVGDIDRNKSGEGLSTARRATSAFLQSMFSTNDTVDDGESATGMALVVHVELEGLDIVLAPEQGSEVNSETEWSNQSHQNSQHPTLTPGQEQDSSAPGFFSSLVDSAMKSLRLSIDVSDVRVRAYSQYCNGPNETATIHDNMGGFGGPQCWLSLRIASARYYDLLIDSRDGGTHASGAPSDNKRLGRSRDHSEKSKTAVGNMVRTAEKMAISKAFDWDGIVVDTGESHVSGGIGPNASQRASLPLFQSSGGGKLRFRVFEKWSESASEQNALFVSARQDIEVSLGQHMAIEADLCSMTRIIEIANAMTRSREEDGDFVDACEDDNCRTWEADSDLLEQNSSTENAPAKSSQKLVLEDEFSRETYDQIMKQYAEARHLARTRELRGGLLIPSFDDSGDNNQNDSGDISFDAFFDANDHSVSYYCSMIDEKGGEEGQSIGEESNSRRMEQIKIEIGLAEFAVKVHIGSAMMEGMSPQLLHNTILSASMEQERKSEYIMISAGDLRVIAFGSNGESKLNCSLSHFDVESQVIDAHNEIINEPILRFLDDSDGDYGSEMLVSSPPCLSLMAEVSDEGDEDKHNSCRVDVALQPFEVIYQDRALRCLSAIMAKLPKPEAPASDSEQITPSRNIHLSVTCSSILLMVPCRRVTKQTPRVAKPNPLFRRHGYKDKGSGRTAFLGIGMELDNIALNLSQKTSVGDTAQTKSEEFKAAMSCSNIILFAKGTELERVRRHRKFVSFISRRVDLVAIAGDEDSETSVLISFTTKRTGDSSAAVKSSSHTHQSTKPSGAFPIILPLSSAKARQEMDESDDEIDNFYDDASKTTGGSSRIQSSDPQYILSSEANEAEKELVINLPNIFFDSTSAERQELSNLLSSIHSDAKDSESSNSGDQANPTDAHVLRNNLLGLAVNVGQISVVLHGEQNDSYSVCMDKMQAHTLIGCSGVRNVRFLSHDVTLYELSKFCPAQNVYAKDHYQPSCSDRCKRIRERLTTRPSTLARAIFFRQKLCQSLSPETPAFLMDILLRGDDEFGETSVHVNIYDMTYRYIMDSEWIQNVTALIRCESGRKEDEDISESSPSMVNLFVNIADCNMDYTPPLTFRNPSRVILRVGEIRFSSNIVTPAATVQAYKVSLSDLRLHICNYRHSYNEENSLLSCAHRHLSKDDIFVPEGGKCLSGRSIVGLEDALCRMGFVNVVVLDTLGAIIFKSNNVRLDCRQNEPAITVTLTLGKLSIYACHDSFSCLNQTYNEWFIKKSALSEEELERLRNLSETQSEVGQSKSISSAREEGLLTCEPPLAPASAPKSESLPKLVKNQGITHTPVHKPPTSKQCQHRDDTVSLDLTKSLLFQNYYTIDASANHHATVQRQETEKFLVRRKNGDLTLKPSSSDDEWATVEHDFLQHSNIPCARDHTAEWVLCDSQASVRPTPKTAPTSTQHRTVKVFPQHIPVKPVLDPFAGSNKVDTAKLAGTNVAPDIGVRVSVKDGSITFRFFDGFDWVNDAPQFHQQNERPKDRKTQLLSSLIAGDDSNSALDVTPLPEERNKSLQHDIARRKLCRNTHRYFQLQLQGLKLKNDSFTESTDHLLASCLDLSVSDFFIAETISTGDPIKMMGEWVNEVEHPRDNSDGIIMLKMMTRRPKLRVSSDGKLMSDESRAHLELLPLRCYLNQNALRFIRNFFAGNQSATEGEDTINSEEEENEDEEVEEEIIDIFFENFKVRPCKFKVDYQPENMDIDSFRDGNYIEILNLCPLEDMILTFQPIEMQDLTGWGSVFSELAGRWIEDICSTQAHKFLTRASPFQPFSNLGDPIADLAMVLVVPEGNLADYLKGVVGGTTNFAGKVALEALSTSAKITRFAANQLNSKALPSAGIRSSLPRRPRRLPRHVGDASHHAYASLSGGLREGHNNIVAVPLREYQSNGAGGAARSALKGIPIGVLAPVAGVSEALSYTLLGLRNQLRPDIRKEDEASLRGLNYD